MRPSEQVYGGEMMDGKCENTMAVALWLRRWASGRTLMLTGVALVSMLAQGCDAEGAPLTNGGASVTYTVSVREGIGGQMLAAGNGWTLYVFDRDTSNHTQCIEGCAVTWPPLTIEGAQPTQHPELPGTVAVFKRPDGRMQVSYNGRPLYYFADDAAAGDTGGDGIGAVWHIARPSIAEEFRAARSAPSAVVSSTDSRAWDPAHVGIAPGGTVRWRNFDTDNAHSVACLTAESTGQCPWTDVLQLPPATRSAAGEVSPSEADATFGRPGVFVFQCTVFPEMKGSVTVGAPATPAGR